MRQGGLGLIQSRSIVLVVKHDKSLTRLDALIIINVHFADRSGDSRAQRRHVRSQIGVIRHLIGSASLPPRQVSGNAEKKARSSEQDDQRYDQRFLLMP